MKKNYKVATSGFNPIYYLLNSLLVLPLGVLYILNWWGFFNHQKDSKPNFK